MSATVRTHRDAPPAHRAAYPRRAPDAGDPRPPAGRARDPLELLTRREREVAGQVGRGASNAEIAVALGIGVRTVEFHLTNVYRKLDIARRTQLAALVASSGPHLATPDGRWGGS